ncbi:hypothetical protein HAV_00191 [Candidatus Hepatincola sp. Av]
MAIFIFFLNFVALVLAFKQHSLQSKVVFFIGLVAILFWLNHHSTNALNISI